MEFPVLVHDTELPPTWVEDSTKVARWDDPEQRDSYCWECEGLAEKYICQHEQLVHPSIWKELSIPASIDPMLTLVRPPTTLQPAATLQGAASSGGMVDPIHEYTYQGDDEDTPAPSRGVTPVRDLGKRISSTPSI
ncbi:hypothetical protein M408DRAFT_30054 [Serendipita vermifera MAFF 305830]|uniref:Uncharacterized protein n=1 Tax=Serendipita vermifera MAFF 305830 TaxID=933852 RepID=A0A0C3AL96_SERVB|nr:hypothetical protein M408DRAFT_30054 [Serendipita vermifera MAFF 305830]